MSDCHKHYMEEDDTCPYCERDAAILRVEEIQKESDLRIRELVSTLGFAKDAIASGWAALGDNLESQALGGKGIEKPYTHTVQSELRAAEERISKVLDKQAVCECGWLDGGIVGEYRDPSKKCRVHDKAKS
jgi:hypothetical protein